MNVFRTWLDAERGRRLRLATQLGVVPSAISAWSYTVPVERVEQVSKLTGIPAAELRPDLARIFNGSGEAA